MYASALSYASPYKGAGRSGYIHTTLHPSHSYSHSGITTMAQAPMATMGSTSSIARGITNSGSVASVNTMDVRGIQTSASAIRGGCLAATTYASIGARPRRSPIIPDDPWWSCGCVDEDGDEICDRCHCDLRLVDEGGECDCKDESGYCWCPIGFDWEVWLLMATLAAAYGVYKKRTSTVQ